MPRVGHVVIAEIEELYRTRRPEFCRAAAAIAGDRNLAEDAVQEAFAKAVRKRRSFKGRGTLEAWVWRIVVNTARDARQRVASPHTRQIRAADVGAGSNGHVTTLPFELLTDRQREVLFLHYYADLDYATIAEALGISPGTVGATLSSARSTLRRALTQEVTG
jgi:RNA polymerase sigma-70 factor (ECF subfamily)